jgi:hypothetical protein
MNQQNNGHEHEFEPELGLPEPLPAGEKILWQGSPDFADMAYRVFHLKKFVFYFGLMLLYRAVSQVSEGKSAVDTLFAMVFPAVLTVVALASVMTLAWLSARTTVYTLTDQRVVMRIGIVLTLTFNLPLKVIESAGLNLNAKGFGDIPLKLKGEDRIAWLNLWPHARPWLINKPEPMMRCIPDASVVAEKLVQAWSNSTGIAVEPADKVEKAVKNAVNWNPSLT